MKLRIEKVGGEYFLDAVENNSIKNIAVFKNYDDALRARDALLAKPPCYNRPSSAEVDEYITDILTGVRT